MNDEIFGRAAVAKAVAQIDLDAADACDPLDQYQFGFAILERAVGDVALAGKFGKMLLQIIRIEASKRLGIGTVGSFHAALAPGGIHLIFKGFSR